MLSGTPENRPARTRSSRDSSEPSSSKARISGSGALLADMGLDRAEVEGFLQGDHGADEVRRELEQGRGLGINAVPHFLIDGRPPLSGAHEPESIVAALEQAAESRRELP